MELSGELYALLPPRRGLALVRHVAQQRLHHCLQAAAVDGHLASAADCEILSRLVLVQCSGRLPACLYQSWQNTVAHEPVCLRQTQAQGFACPQARSILLSMQHAHLLQ